VPGAEGARPGAEEKTVKAAERDREDVAEARRAWRAELAGIDPARLVFIDETGIDTRMTRPYARAARGQRAVGKVPRGRWERLTVIGALALDGLVASRGVAAATGTAVFLAFAEEVLIPALRPARRARGDGRPRRPQGREGARGAGPRRPGPPRTLASGRRSRTRGCRPTRRT
jgi:hypothetical protein